MKRVLIAILAPMLISAGLVAGGATPTSAQPVPTIKPSDCPYTGCIATRTRMPKPDAIKKRNRPIVSVRVHPTSGNATATGVVKIKALKIKNGRKVKKKVINYSYTGNSWQDFKGPRLGAHTTKNRKWRIKAVFKGDSPFLNSKKARRIRVTR